MAKTLYSFVLEDDLYLEYHKFMNPKDYDGEYDKDTIKKLLSFHVYPFLFNKKQLERLDIDIPNNLKNQLQHASSRNCELATLADETVFKCILSKNKDKFPYININSDKIRTSITGTFFSTESRDKAKSHIQRLCKDARSITLHDKYLSRNEARQICDLLPKRNNLTICIHNGNISGGSYVFDDINTVLCSYCQDWVISPQNLLVNSHHDRYLIIDDQMAVIVTSGFSNLFSDLKDVTYIVTRIEANPLIRP